MTTPAKTTHGASPAEVLAGFSRIRATAETYMDKSDLAGDGWIEEDVTAVCVIEGRPHVQVVKFNRNQEGLGKHTLGADYLWWWIDSSSGECFGMLVQAKRLKLANGQWRVDISHRDGSQLSDLLRTADQLQVPAVYSVDTGPALGESGHTLHWSTWGRTHQGHADHARYKRRMTVTISPQIANCLGRTRRTVSFLGERWASGRTGMGRYGTLPYGKPAGRDAPVWGHVEMVRDLTGREGNYVRGLIIPWLQVG